MVILISVLKVFLFLLLTLAVLFAVVLLFPVTYRFDGDIDHGKYLFRIRWLFGLIRFRFRYEKKAEAVLHILFVKLDFTDPAKKEKQKKRKAKRAAKKKRKKDRKKAKKQKALEREREKNRREIRLDEETVGAPDMEKAAETASATEERAEAAGIRIPDNVKKFLGILRTVHDSRVFGAVLPKLQIFLLHIRPRQLQGQIGFGFADPSLTGKVLGAAAAVPFLFGTDLSVCPDFDTEKTYVSGEVHVRGHMFVLHLLGFFIRLISDKQVRGFLSALRRKKK